MERWTATAVAALAALAIGITPALAGPVVTRHYYAELYRYPQGGFPSSGTLDLIFREDGSIAGYYRPLSGGGVAPVSGYVRGSSIALDIGGSDALHVSGTLIDGTISGRAFRSFGNQVFRFRGLPIANDSALPKIPQRGDSTP